MAHKIVLLGYMGCGKTSVGKILSEKTNIPLTDLDDLIEKRENNSVKNIFATRGEIYFRRIEHQILKEILSSPESLIVSLGGGTPCYANNHQFLNGENIVSFYLKASIKTLYDRLYHETDKRPLLNISDENELQEFIAKHLFDRSYFYNQATYNITVDGKSLDEISAEIISKLT
ncbi:AAA family ATPase [Flavobacterium sp. NST-5]|uniref:Shikimate kinase n=1 Tax=Flavobacterium ichthyis TaxID=2698827 RepID=A0ABW9ZD59_9FLAO|nr:shikimate kinase [Flavobacterium ichthyis]NBL66041.1 AAA family ATPase [Flavobacterium ichthyis]